MELIEILTRLLMGLFMSFIIGTAASPPPVRPPEPPVPDSSSGGAQPFRSDVTVLDVQVVVMESFPMQVVLEVRGEFPSGCDFPAQVQQRREGNAVVVEVYQEIPPDVLCPMILRPYNDTIRLEGDFEPGDYIFQVNDFVVEQTL